LPDRARRPLRATAPSPRLSWRRSQPVERTASTRQKKQLAHDDARQAKALDAEAERHAYTLPAETSRLESQLAQEAAELAELRRVLDAATDALTAATTSVLESRRRWINIPAAPTAAEVSQVSQSHHEAGATLSAASAAWFSRRKIRLGVEHPVTRSLYRALQSLVDVRELIDPSAVPPEVQRSESNEREAVRVER
jgi:hypothetical protein